MKLRARFVSVFGIFTILFVSLVILAVLVFALKILPTQSPLANAKSFNSQNFIQAKNSSVIEYMKKTQPDGYEEYWRDPPNLKDRVDTYNLKGELISSYIMVDGGERVIHITGQDGKLGAETWILPRKIAEENKKIIKTSLFEMARNDEKTEEYRLIENAPSNIFEPNVPMKEIMAPVADDREGKG